MSLLMVLVGCIIVFDQFFAKDNLRQNNLYEFQIGILVGLAMVGVVRIIRLNNILSDEKKIRIAFNDEHDERKKAIREKSGLPVLLCVSIGMIVVGIIAGYYNFTVFVTLVVAGVVQMIVGIILKFINTKHM